MRGTRSLFCFFAVLTVALVSLTSCRPQRLWEGDDPAVDGGTTEPPTYPVGDGGGSRTPDFPPPMPPDVGLGETIPPATGAEASAYGFIQEKRWEGVAVYFAYDRYSIGTSERPKLETLAEYMQQNARYCVMIEGHADSRGSNEYNRGLSEKRALAVKDYLVTLGIGNDRLDTIAYGEDKPAVPGASSEADHALNRRAEFVIGIRP